MSATPAIATRGLRKVFGDKVAVARLDLAVDRGEVFGFLGPNGAGKSTSVKMLLGLVHPTSGEASALGAPAGHVETRRRIGFLPELFRFHDWFTGEEMLLAHGRLCGLEGPTLVRRVGELLERVGMAEHAHRRIGEYSKGMSQRVGLAQALLHRPELLFLDEPTSGLDPSGWRMVRQIIFDERERGATIFLNSHLLGEVELTCDRVAFMRSGETVDALALGDAAETIVSIQADGLPSDVAERLTGVEVLPDGLRVTLDSQDGIPAAIETLVAMGARIYSVTPERPSLEQRFLDTVGEEGGL
ncbi:MAG: ABC transporter ATP-binding protein [Bryobacterales bacterium]|nr:ABC transporter ATP-binding protein [Bryobacterales bacterium]